eukprot:TRINITY_DN23408_c0_g1_i1.p1 TRINITY_DN23408_c0_g1~~TRINITY_DN23408_c0_g1_i1.p1  ORF type:complete len:156 (-),score=36.11 TRINITY_DN23408_c0_g1_i1:99-566(-)
MNQEVVAKRKEASVQRRQFLKDMREISFKNKLPKRLFPLDGPLSKKTSQADVSNSRMNAYGQVSATGFLSPEVGDDKEFRSQYTQSLGRLSQMWRSPSRGDRSRLTNKGDDSAVQKLSDDTMFKELNFILKETQEIIGNLAFLNSAPVPVKREPR